jgi:putative ABC transport system permease protein
MAECQYRGRLTTLVFAVVVGSVASLVCIGLVGHAARAAQTSINEGVALRAIELKADSDRADVKQLHDEALNALRSTAHVEAVEPWAQVSFGIKTPTIGGLLVYATSVRRSAPPPILHSTRTNVFPLHANEVLLPADSQGKNFGSLVGQQIPISYTRKTGEGTGESATDTVTVVGVYDPSFAIDGPSAYADVGAVVRWASAKAGVAAVDYASTVGYRKGYVIVDASDNLCESADVT